MLAGVAQRFDLACAKYVEKAERSIKFSVHMELNDIQADECDLGKEQGTRGAIDVLHTRDCNI